MVAAAPDVTALDVGNVLLLEHLNMQVPDQLEATLFYIVGLGLTRDPYGAVSTNNMHVNVGDHQFHLPTRTPQIVGGHVGMVLPNLDAVEKQLESVQPQLAHTKLAWHRESDHLAVTCPWGNTLRCFAPSERWGGMKMGIPYIEFMVKPGAAAGIARFYEDVFHAPSEVQATQNGPAATVHMGLHQALVFQETAGEIRPYDGYHVAVYVADFSGTYTYLKDRGHLTEDIRAHQFRFQALLDPDSGEVLHELEHEVRNLHHPQFRRVLINRDPAAR
jgi:hypothetical protein